MVSLISDEYTFGFIDLVIEQLLANQFVKWFTENNHDLSRDFPQNQPTLCLLKPILQMFANIVVLEVWKLASNKDIGQYFAILP